MCAEPSAALAERSILRANVSGTASVAQKSLVKVILDDYLYKEDVLTLLGDLSDYQTGTKEAAIRRLLKNRHFDPRQTLRLLNKSQLSDLCRQRGKNHLSDREHMEASLSDVLLEEPGGRRTRLAPQWWTLVHPIVREAAGRRFESGQLADSVEAALKEVSVRVKNQYRAKCGKELDGSKLMTQAFALDNPPIPLADLGDISGRDEQQGYMHLFAGSMLAIRNPKAHANVRIDERRAIHHLFLASLLMHKLDEAHVP